MKERYPKRQSCPSPSQDTALGPSLTSPETTGVGTQAGLGTLGQLGNSALMELLKRRAEGTLTQQEEEMLNLAARPLGRGPRPSGRAKALGAGEVEPADLEPVYQALLSHDVVTAAQLYSSIVGANQGALLAQAGSYEEVGERAAKLLTVLIATRDVGAAGVKAWATVSRNQWAGVLADAVVACSDVLNEWSKKGREPKFFPTDLLVTKIVDLVLESLPVSKTLRGAMVKAGSRAVASVMVQDVQGDGHDLVVAAGVAATEAIRDVALSQLPDKDLGVQLVSEYLNVGVDHTLGIAEGE